MVLFKIVQLIFSIPINFTFKLISILFVPESQSSLYSDGL